MQNSAPAISARPLPAIHKAVLVVGGSLAVAICARFSCPLAFTPVYLTLANFAVLLVGLTLGSRAGFAALALYLAEGAMGLPVFSPAGPGGIAQLLGPTGGYLVAYPLAAFLAGFIAERLPRKFSFYALAALAGNAVIFAGGICWLMVWTRGAVGQAVQFGLYPFVFAEVMKTLAAAGAQSAASSKLHA